MKLSSKAIIVMAVIGLVQSGWTQEMLLAAKGKAASSNKSVDAGTNFKQMGDQYFKKGDFTSAIAAYQEFINANADDSAAGRVAKRVGEYCYANKQYADAATYLSMVKGTRSMEVPFKLMLGRSLHNAGKSNEAIELLQPLAILTTIKIDARQLIFKTLGDAYLATGQNDKALDLYERYQKLSIVKGGVKSPDVSYNVAFLQEGTNPAKARLQYEDNIKKFPADQRNFLRLGVLLSKDKATLKQSAVVLKKAVDMADTIPSAWLEIARVYGRINKPDEELAAYEHYRKFDTANLEAKTRIGTIILGKGFTEEAIKLLKEVHQQAPDSTLPMAALADGYLRTGKTKEAIDLLIKAKTAKPKDTMVRRLLFEAYRVTKQDQLALVEIKALLDLKRDNDLLLSYGKLLLKLGKYDEAANTIEDIRATEPENLDALMMLGKVLRAQKKFDEAMEIYKEATTIDLKYAPATFERAEVYLEQGKVKWAEQFYKRALEQDPTMALAMLGLAKVALVYKNRGVYLEFLDKAEAMDPQNWVIKKEREKSRTMK